MAAEICDLCWRLLACCLRCWPPQTPGRPTSRSWSRPSIRASSCGPQRLRLLRARTRARLAALAAVRIAHRGQRPHARTGLRQGALLPGRRRRRRRHARPSPGRSRPAADLRQLALVFDWCQDLLTDAQRATWPRAAKGIADTAANEPSPPCAPARWPRWRCSIMCRKRRSRNWSGGPQLVGAQDRPGTGAPATAWCRATTPIRCRNCSTPCATTPISTCANRPARSSRTFPIEHLMSYYPATYPGAGERLLHRRGRAKAGEPDLRLAALSRAAELAMVALRRRTPPRPRCCRAG